MGVGLALDACAELVHVVFLPGGGRGLHFLCRILTTKLGTPRRGRAQSCRQGLGVFYKVASAVRCFCSVVFLPAPPCQRITKFNSTTTYCSYYYNHVGINSDVHFVQWLYRDTLPPPSFQLQELRGKPGLSTLHSSGGSQNKGYLLGASIIRIIAYWGLYWGSLNFGKLLS